MKIKNIGTKVINIGQCLLLPDQECVPNAADGFDESNEVLKLFEHMGLIQIIHDQKRGIKEAEEPSEETEGPAVENEGEEKPKRGRRKSKEQAEAPAAEE